MPFDIVDPFPSFLFAFAIAIAVLHLLLVWPRNLGKKSWKYVDYIWLLAAFISVISLSSEIRLRRVELFSGYALTRTEGMKELFVNLFVNEPPAYICREFVETEFSPDNLVELQMEYTEACAWFGEIGEAFLSRAVYNAVVDFSSLNPPEFQDRMLNDVVAGVGRQLSYYNEAALELQTLQGQRKLQPHEELFENLWPLFFMFALALRVTKVTGELRHEL